MFIIIFIAVVLISLLLYQQGLRHRLELKLEYERQKIPIPQMKPKNSVLVSWMNIVLGILMLGMGSISLWALFTVASHFVNHPEIKIERIQWEMAAVFVAAGIALPILGILSLIKNYKYSKSLKEESK
jgi:hypothetical protein